MSNYNRDRRLKRAQDLIKYVEDNCSVTAEAVVIQRDNMVIARFKYEDSAIAFVLPDKSLADKNGNYLHLGTEVTPVVNAAKDIKNVFIRVCKPPHTIKNVSMWRQQIVNLITLLKIDIGSLLLIGDDTLCEFIHYANAFLVNGTPFPTTPAAETSLYSISEVTEGTKFIRCEIRDSREDVMPITLDVDVDKQLLHVSYGNCIYSVIQKTIHSSNATYGPACDGIAIAAPDGDVLCINTHLIHTLSNMRQLIRRKADAEKEIKEKEDAIGSTESKKD